MKLAIALILSSMAAGCITIEAKDAPRRHYKAPAIKPANEANARLAYSFDQVIKHPISGTFLGK